MSIYFPPLRYILDSFRQDWLSGQGLHNLEPSLTVLVAGFRLAVLVGSAGGAVMRLSRFTERATHPLLGSAACRARCRTAAGAQPRH
ncbi:hypothetical protein AB0436_29195 [Streptomyces sp. NPDC051322]|uniref:hypothetical protein n=1 Tax=Streptomyces sp. NPDC051322 TaxID=3154645 RepID=UPI00344F2987